MSVFFFGYALTQIPAGFFASRFGTRALVSFAAMGFSVFTFLIGTARSALMIKWFRVGLGAFEGPFAVGSTSTIKNWFPPQERGIATGFYIGATTIAVMLTPPVAVRIMLHWGWRNVFFVFAVPGIILGVIWYYLVRTRPEQSAYVNSSEIEYINDVSAAELEEMQQKSFGLLDRLIRAKKVKLLETSSEVLRSWNVWGITISYFFLQFITYGLMTWVPSYLVNAKGYSLLTMGWVAAAPWLGGFLGCISGGWFSDKVMLKRRKPGMFITMISTVIMMFIIAHVAASVMVVALVLFLTGYLLHVGFPACTAYPMGLTTGKTYPVAVSILSTGGSLGGVVSPVTAGYLLDRYKSYNFVFMFFAACAVLALICSSTIDEPLH